MSIFSRLNEKDRRALFILLTFFVLMSLYWGVKYSTTYLSESKILLRENRESALTLFGYGKRVSQMELAKKNKIKVGENQPLMTLVSNTAKEKKLTFKRIQPEGDSSLKVSLEETNFDMMLWWLVEIKNKHGIEVVDIAVERTKRDGFVDARINLVR